MSVIKPVKRYTLDATGTVLDIRHKINSSGSRYREIEFSDYKVALPSYIATVIKVGDNIHAYFVHPCWTNDMAALEQVVLNLRHVCQDYDIRLGYWKLLGCLDMLHRGFWVVEPL